MGLGNLEESRLLIYKGPVSQTLLDSMVARGYGIHYFVFFEKKVVPLLKISLEGNTDSILVKMTFSIFPGPGFWYNNFLILTFHILPFEKFKSESSPGRRRSKPELRWDPALPFSCLSVTLPSSRLFGVSHGERQLRLRHELAPDIQNNSFFADRKRQQPLHLGNINLLETTQNLRPNYTI